MGLEYPKDEFAVPSEHKMESIKKMFTQAGYVNTYIGGQLFERRMNMAKVLKMEEEKRGMNERIQKLREQSVTTEPRLYMERADLMTDAYLKYEGSVSVPVMRALAFKHFMENKTLNINDGELIVGEKGDGPQAAPSFPELCCHTLEDMEVMNARDLISFKVTEEDLKLQEEKIIPYWEKRSVRNKILNAMTQEWKDTYAAGIFTEFMEQRGPGHTVGSENIFNKGFNEHKEDIAKAIENLDLFNDVDALDKWEQLKAMDIACDAIIVLGERYAAFAREEAAKETDPVRKEELLQIAATFNRLLQRRY